MSVQNSSVLAFFCILSALEDLNLPILHLSPPNIPVPDLALSSFLIKHPSSTWSLSCPSRCLVKDESRN